MRRLLISLGIIFLALFVTAPVLAAEEHQNYNQSVGCNGLESVGVEFTDCRPEAADSPGASADSDKFTNLVTNIINIFSMVVGAVSVLMLVIGGFRYIVSSGDSSGVQGAKNTIIYALVGLAVVFFAQIITRFVITVTT